jgi:hypothetical protein
VRLVTQRYHSRACSTYVEVGMEHGVYLEATGRGYVEVTHLVRAEKGNAAGFARAVILCGFRARESCIPQDLDQGIRRAVA